MRRDRRGVEELCADARTWTQAHRDQVHTLTRMHLARSLVAVDQALAARADPGAARTLRQRRRLHRDVARATAALRVDLQRAVSGFRHPEHLEQFARDADQAIRAALDQALCGPLPDRTTPDRDHQEAHTTDLR